MKKFGNLTEESTTDVNGSWKPLKPLQEGFEFVGDEEYDNLVGRKAQERRDERRDKKDERKEIKTQAKAGGASNKEARKTARQTIPTNKPARREAYLALVKINFRGFAYKLDAIINGTNTNLSNELKDKWRKFGDYNELIDAVNKGKVKKPFVCGAKCRREALDIKNFSNVLAETTIAGLLALAGSVVGALGGVLRQAQIGNQQRDAIESSEKQAENEFNNLSPEEQRAILEAEAKLRQEVQSSDNKKYIYIGIGVVALAGIIYILTKKKK
jgi:hypothetical protein